MDLCIGLILLIAFAPPSIDPNATPVQLLAWYDVPPKASRDVRVVLRVYAQSAMDMFKESDVRLVTPQLFRSKYVLKGDAKAFGVIGDDVLVRIRHNAEIKPGQQLFHHCWDVIEWLQRPITIHQRRGVMVSRSNAKAPQYFLY